MPKTNTAYGNSYKPCPCAQVIDNDANGKGYFTCKCFSPKRSRTGIKINDSGQTRICMGGTTQGKRYTSCPYYERGASPKGAGYRKKIRFSLLIRVIPIVFVLLALASSCLNSGAQYSKVFALFFVLLTIIFLSIIFQKSDQITDTKKKKK